MARSPTSPSAQLASGWGVVQRAWERKEDITLWLDAIDWDSPVFAWGEKTSEEHTGGLHHPLAYALSLSDPALGQAIVEAKAMHAWSSVPATLLQSDKRYPVSALSDLWGWEVAQAVVAHKAFKALPLLADGIARGISQSRYPSLAGNALGKILATAPWDVDAICRAIEILQPALDTHVKETGSLAWKVLMEACKAGKGDVAVGVFQHFPSHANVSLTFLKDLALYEQFSQALFLLNQSARLGIKGEDPFRGSRWSGSDSQLQAEACLVLSYAMKAVVAARTRANPSPAQQKKADAAEDLVMEMCRRFRFPVHDVSSSSEAATYAQVLAYLPDAFPQVKSSAVVSEAVLKHWWTNGPVDGGLFRACFENFTRVNNHSVIQQFLEAGIELKIEAVGLNKQLPFVKKLEKLPVLLEELRVMEEPLGMDSMVLLKHHMPASFLTGKLGNHWKETLADYRAKTLEANLPGASSAGSKPRL